MDHGFTEIQETLNSHLGVPYFSKAPSLNALSYTKSTTHLILYYELGPMGPIQPTSMVMGSTRAYSA